MINLIEQDSLTLERVAKFGDIIASRYGCNDPTRSIPYWRCAHNNVAHFTGNAVQYLFAFRFSSCPQRAGYGPVTQWIRLSVRIEAVALIRIVERPQSMYVPQLLHFFIRK